MQLSFTEGKRKKRWESAIGGETGKVSLLLLFLVFGGAPASSSGYGKKLKISSC
jgi:hypothetical protein